MSIPMIRFATLAALLLPVAFGSPVAAQAGPNRGRASAAPPTISARSFTGGSARVTVTGGIRIDADVPINTQASMADGEMTWLQFGAAGSRDPNALITVSAQEIGLSAGQGKQLFTIGAASCSGTINVTATVVSGRYTCKDVTAYDAGTGRMSTVQVVIGFTARS